MKTFLQSLLLLFFVSGSNAQNLEWAAQVGGIDRDQGNSIAVDDSGNVYVTGSYESIVDFDPGPNQMLTTAKGSDDIFILKLNASGQFCWVKTIGGHQSDTGFRIELDNSGNVYVTGWFRDTVDFDPGPGIQYQYANQFDNVFLLKLNPAGSFQWVRSFGGNNWDKSFDLEIDQTRNMYIAGTFRDTADFDPGINSALLVSTGVRDAFIVKLDSTGQFVWAKSFGGPLEDFVFSIAIDANQCIYTTGSFEYSADFDPGLGTLLKQSAGHDDIFIQKLSANGELIWVETIGDTVSDSGSTILLDQLGNLYVSGTFSGTVDFNPDSNTAYLSSKGQVDIFILKMDTASNFKWATQMGSQTSDYSSSMCQDHTGNIIHSGLFSGKIDVDPGSDSLYISSQGVYDFFIRKIDSNAHLIWAYSAGSNYTENCSELHVDAANRIYLTGMFNDTMDVDFSQNVVQLSCDYSDVFILKLNTYPLEVNKAYTALPILTYPNPNSGLLHIESDKSLENVTIQIFNAFGTSVFKKSFPNLRSTTIELPQPNGFYFLMVQSPEGFYSTGILKRQ